MCSPVEIIPCLARQSSSSELPQPCHKPALPLTLAAVLAEAKAGGGPAAPPGPALRWVLANAARHLVPELDTLGQSFSSIARPRLLSLEYVFKAHSPSWLIPCMPLPRSGPHRAHPPVRTALQTPATMARSRVAAVEGERGALHQLGQPKLMPLWDAGSAERSPRALSRLCVLCWMPASAL